MRLFKIILIKVLAAGAGPLRAWAQVHPPHRLRVKVGFNLAHLVVIPEVRGRLVVPLALGAEYRVASRGSLYAQAEAYLPTGRAPRGRRVGIALPLASGAGALGVRYYYHHAKPADSLARSARFGDYLAFEGNGEWQALAAARGRGRTTPAQFTPVLDLPCGTQCGWAGHSLLFDASTGLGLQTPTYYYNRPEQLPTHA